MPNKDMSQSEYETLREELLSIIARAFDIWRWGLITLFAILRCRDSDPL